MIEVTAFDWVPDVARGYVKDLRVRWALEEAGLPYTERLIDLPQKLGPEHMQRQPFGQVPAFNDGTVDMFESGAIVLRIAEASPALMPADEAGRARVTSWAFAALNSIEPFVMNVSWTELFWPDEPWAPGYLKKAREMLDLRLGQLETWLAAREYLEGGRFTAGDLLMASVLRDLERHDTLPRFPAVEAYFRRCTGRAAFARALAAQLKALATGKAPEAVAG